MWTHRRASLSVVTTVSVVGLTLAGCTVDTETDSDSSDAATVMATTTQVGSVAQQITECGGGDIQVLMSAGDDPHSFEASSAQIADMITADIVFANGLGLEASMQRSLDNAAADGANIVEVGPELDPLPLNENEDHDHADHEHTDDGHDHGSQDAHVWMDVSRMADAAELMGDHIAEASGNDAYVDCGHEVAEELRDVDGEIEELMSTVDSARLVTDHDAYGYFADRYGVEISGVVVPGGSTDGEPSSQDLTELTALLDDEGADALVTSKANTNRMISALAAETQGDVPVIELYESAIGESGSDAETYQDAMLYNAEALAETLN